MVRNAVRNITKLIFGFVWHKIIVETRVRIKWLCQHMLATSLGYKSHADYLQKFLDLRIERYEALKIAE